MNLIIAAVGSVPYFPLAVKCAKQRSGCVVHVVSTVPGYIEGAHEIGVSDIKDPLWRFIGYGALFQVRWFLVRWLVDKLSLEPPYYCPDWDVFNMWDVTGHIRSMSDKGVLATQEIGTCRGAAWVIANKSILDAYCDFAINRAVIARCPGDLSDMHTWVDFCRENNVQVGNLADKWDSGVFDHNIHTGEQQYVFDGQTKKITWHDYHPYFTDLKTGEAIKARTIHCWGTYKERYPELLTHSGIE